MLLGRRQQRLAEHRQPGRVHRELAARRAPHDALDADQIAEIEQPQHRHLVGGQEILVAEDLDLAGLVVQVDEHAGIADRQDPARDRDLVLGHGAGRQVAVFRVERGGIGRAGKAVRIGVDPELLQLMELGEPRFSKLVSFFLFRLFRHRPTPLTGAI